MPKIKTVFLCLILVPCLSLAAEPSVTFSVKSTSVFADTDKNGVIDSKENKTFESEKLKIFDANRNGKLDDPEKEKFNYIDQLIASGGKSLDGLSDKDRQLYKKWRTFILSLIEKSKENSLSKGQASGNKIIKCYPEKVCDDPSSPNFGSASGDLPAKKIKSNDNKSLIK